MAWQLIVDEQHNQDFVGHAEKCTYEFSLGPEWVPGMGLLRDYMINRHIDELAKDNSQLLELRVWEDTEPFFKTHYWVEVVATASPLLWYGIIGGILLVVFGFAVLFTIKSIEDIVKYVGGTVSKPMQWGMLAVVGIIAVGLLLGRRKK